MTIRQLADESLLSGGATLVGGTVWITGLAAAGKTTLSEGLGAALRDLGLPCVVLDGETLRMRMRSSYGHSLEDRFAVLREIVAFALEERDKGLIPIVATISHKREMRAFARQSLGRMLEVYLDCSAAVCAARDRKGHYRRAHAGEYDCFVGVTEPYEVWEQADLVIDTAGCSEAEASAALRRAAVAFLFGRDAGF
jgi:adenylylsulfate kinase